MIYAKVICSTLLPWSTSRVQFEQLPQHHSKHFFSCFSFGGTISNVVERRSYRGFGYLLRMNFLWSFLLPLPCLVSLKTILQFNSVFNSHDVFQNIHNLVIYLSIRFALSAGLFINFMQFLIWEEPNSYNCGWFWLLITLQSFS